MKLKNKKVPLSAVGIKELIGELNNIKEDLELASKDIVNDLVEGTKETIQKNFDSTYYKPDDVDYIVDATYETENKAKVFARGTSVIYMEFGTGEIGKRSEQNPMRESFPLNDFNSGRVVSKLVDEMGDHYWVYNGIQKGIPAGCQVYNALQELRNVSESAAKEIVRRRIS